jgi:hypothetical protein
VQAVDVYGRIPQVIAAQGKISAVLGMEAEAWAADVDWGARICMQLLPEMASLLIGKKGSTIQSIQGQSGARVRVAREEGAIMELQPVTVRSLQVPLRIPCDRSSQPQPSGSVHYSPGFMGSISFVCVHIAFAVHETSAAMPSDDVVCHFFAVLWHQRAGHHCVLPRNGHPTAV